MKCPFEIPGPKVIKLFPCSTQLSMEFYLLINSILLISTVIFLFSLTRYYKFPMLINNMATPTKLSIFIFISRNVHAQLS